MTKPKSQFCVSPFVGFQWTGQKKQQYMVGYDFDYRLYSGATTKRNGERALYTTAHSLIGVDSLNAYHWCVAEEELIAYSEQAWRYLHINPNGQWVTGGCRNCRNCGLAWQAGTFGYYCQDEDFGSSYVSRMITAEVYAIEGEDKELNVNDTFMQVDHGHGSGRIANKKYGLALGNSNSRTLLRPGHHIPNVVPGSFRKGQYDNVLFGDASRVTDTTSIRVPKQQKKKKASS